jgi:hypothetical protein
MTKEYSITALKGFAMMDMRAGLAGRRYSKNERSSTKIRLLILFASVGRVRKQAPRWEGQKTRLLRRLPSSQ